MIRIYLTLVDIVPAAVVLIPLFLIFYFTIYKRNARKSFLYSLFCLYLSAVFALVGIPNITYFRPDLNLNLIPFSGMISDLKNSVLNIALLLPFGFFLPVLWGKFRKLRSAVMMGFSLSLFIELLQTLTFRATDVNDLITNVLGTVTGFLIAKPIADKCLPVAKENRDVYGLIMLSFGIMFFVHPFLSPMIWDRIL